MHRRERQDAMKHDPSTIDFARTTTACDILEHKDAATSALIAAAESEDRIYDILHTAGFAVLSVLAAGGVWLIAAYL